MKPRSRGGNRALRRRDLGRDELAPREIRELLVGLAIQGAGLLGVAGLLGRPGFADDRVASVRTRDRGGILVLGGGVGPLLFGLERGAPSQQDLLLQVRRQRRAGR